MQELIFNTPHSALHQCDISESFTLNFHQEQLTLKVCELIAFRRKLQKIDLAGLLASEGPDVEILALPQCDRLFILTVYDVLELRELFAGAFTMLELNSLIHKEIIRKVG